jgi:hypothetical protein
LPKKLVKSVQFYTLHQERSLFKAYTAISAGKKAATTATAVFCGASNAYALRHGPADLFV